MYTYMHIYLVNSTNLVHPVQGAIAGGTSQVAQVDAEAVLALNMRCGEIQRYHSVVDAMRSLHHLSTSPRPISCHVTLRHYGLGYLPSAASRACLVSFIVFLSSDEIGMQELCTPLHDSWSRFVRLSWSLLVSLGLSWSLLVSLGLSWSLLVSLGLLHGCTRRLQCERERLECFLSLCRYRSQWCFSSLALCLVLLHLGCLYWHGKGRPYGCTVFPCSELGRGSRTTRTLVRH